MLQLLYSQIVRTRRRYYQRRPDIRRRLNQPVISVGNLTIGGSGKTPLVAEIARLLLELGERPAILSRGYGRKVAPDGVVVVCDGRHVQTNVDQAGDEPLMLAQTVPGSAVVVHSSRYVAGRVAESKLGCTVHLLDDGFQHLNLMRDVDLLVAPPEDFVETGTLPFGRFREPLDAAATADALLVPAGSSATPDEMGKRLKVSTTFAFQRSIAPPTTVTPAFAFAGIAKPEQFFSDLERLGWTLTARREFPDHYVYRSRDLEEVQKSAIDSGAQTILTTEKDSVRLTGIDTIPNNSRVLPIVSVPLRISIDAPFREWLRDRLRQARVK